MSELRECPFCGGSALLKDKYLCGVANRKNYWIVCGKCQARIQDRNSMVRAITAWNNRSQLELVIEN